MVVAAPRRELLVAAALAVMTAAASGCAPATSPPSVLPSLRTAQAATSPPSPAASPPATAVAGAAPDAEGYVPFTIPMGAVRSAALPIGFGLHRLDSDGPRVVFDQSASNVARSVQYFDLEKGVDRLLAPSPAGYQVWSPAISGTSVAWIEWHYEGANDTGACDWRIEVQDVSGADAARTIARGVQRRAGSGFGASWPALDLDGDRVVYAIEDPAADPSGWQIIVRTLAGDVVATIRTRKPVYDLAASDGSIAWTEGDIDPGLGYTTATHLLVARAGASSGTSLASNAYEVALDRGRVAWSQDAPGGNGAAIGSQIWSADLSTLTPEMVSPASAGTERHQEWPSTGDGLVTWGSERLSMADPSLNGDRLAVWSPTAERAFELQPTPGAILSSAGGGWIVWVNDRTDPQTVSGISEAELGLH